MKGGLYLTLIKLHCSAASEKVCGRLRIEWSNSWLSVCLGSGSKSVSKRSCQTSTMSPMIWKDIMHGKHTEHTISALSEESGQRDKTEWHHAVWVPGLRTHTLGTWENLRRNYSKPIFEKVGIYYWRIEFWKVLQSIGCMWASFMI